MFGIMPVTGYVLIMDSIIMPVPPSGISVKVGGRNKTVDLLSGQQINLLKSPELEEISFECLIPHTKYPFVKVAELKSMSYYIDKLYELATAKKPFAYMLSRNTEDGKSIFPTVITVSIESFSYSESYEYGNDIMVSVTLKRYEYYATKKLYTVESSEDVTSVSVESSSTREDNREVPTYYTVKKGDTLWKICKDYYGDGSRYKEIAELNGIANPNKISVGQQLKMAEK